MGDGFLHKYFMRNADKKMQKWLHYFDIYDVRNRLADFNKKVFSTQKDLIKNDVVKFGKKGKLLRNLDHFIKVFKESNSFSLFDSLLVKLTVFIAAFPVPKLF